MSLGYSVMLKLSALEVGLFPSYLCLTVEVQSFVSVRAGGGGGGEIPHQSPLYWLRNCCAQTICHMYKIYWYYLHSMEDIVLLCLRPLHQSKIDMVRIQKLVNSRKRKKKKGKNLILSIPIEMGTLKRRNQRCLTCNIPTRDHIVVVKNSSNHPKRVGGRFWGENIFFGKCARFAP